jgi:uncharacterized membrane protein YkvA (DUF1232 family)
MEQRGLTDQNAAVLMPKLKAQAAQLKRNIAALYLAARDPRTPWYARAFVIGVVAYALSPIDLIPDFIPILGYLDDLLLLPFGIYIAIKLIPPEILLDCRAKADALGGPLPRSWKAALLVLVLWLVTLALVGYFLWQTFSTTRRANAYSSAIGCRSKPAGVTDLKIEPR